MSKLLIACLFTVIASPVLATVWMIDDSYGSYEQIILDNDNYPRFDPDPKGFVKFSFYDLGSSWAEDSLWLDKLDFYDFNYVLLLDNIGENTDFADEGGNDEGSIPRLVLEPDSLALLGLGLIGLMLTRKYQKQVQNH